MSYLDPDFNIGNIKEDLQKKAEEYMWNTASEYIKGQVNYYYDQYMMTIIIIIAVIALACVLCAMTSCMCCCIFGKSKKKKMNNGFETIN